MPILTLRRAGKPNPGHVPAARFACKEDTRHKATRSAGIRIAGVTADERPMPIALYRLSLRIPASPVRADLARESRASGCPGQRDADGLTLRRAGKPNPGHAPAARFACKEDTRHKATRSAGIRVAGVTADERPIPIALYRLSLRIPASPVRADLARESRASGCPGQRDADRLTLRRAGKPNPEHAPAARFTCKEDTRQEATRSAGIRVAGVTADERPMPIALYRLSLRIPASPVRAGLARESRASGCPGQRDADGLTLRRAGKPNPEHAPAARFSCKASSHRPGETTRPSALCPLPSALCPLPSALCPLPSALCPLPSALCPLTSDL
jgi:hypothetical protein